MHADRKRVAAVLGVLELLRREREREAARERAVSAWALSARQEQAGGPEQLMRLRGLARPGMPGAWRCSG